MANTERPRRAFDAFLDRALLNVETRAAHEDAQTRFRLIDALIARRKQLGLTQAEVARRMGVKQPTVSEFETEGSDPRVSTMQRYARAVEASMELPVHPAGSVEVVREGASRDERLS